MTVSRRPRVGAMILRPHIERHLPEPFVIRTQLQRWDAAATRLIREGQVLTVDPVDGD